MNGKIDWKQKYYELRSKYINAIDVAFRLGVQEGQKNAEMENMQMQLQQMEEQAAMEAEMGGMPDEGMVDENGMPIEGGEELPPEEMMGEEGIPMEGEEGELDASINELEDYVKSEKNVDFVGLMKQLHKSEDKTKKTATKESVDKIDSLIKKWDSEKAE